MFLSLKVPPPEKKQKKETLLSAELGKFLDKKIRVKFQGGREGEWDFIVEMFLLTPKLLTIKERKKEQKKKKKSAAVARTLL